MALTRYAGQQRLSPAANGLFQGQGLNASGQWEDLYRSTEDNTMPGIRPGSDQFFKSQLGDDLTGFTPDTGTGQDPGGDPLGPIILGAMTALVGGAAVWAPAAMGGAAGLSAAEAAALAASDVTATGAGAGMLSGAAGGLTAAEIAALNGSDVTATGAGTGMLGGEAGAVDLGASWLDGIQSPVEMGPVDVEAANLGEVAKAGANSPVQAEMANAGSSVADEFAKEAVGSTAKEGAKKGIIDTAMESFKKLPVGMQAGIVQGAMSGIGQMGAAGLNALNAKQAAEQKKKDAKDMTQYNRDFIQGGSAGGAGVNIGVRAPSQTRVLRRPDGTPVPRGIINNALGA